MRSQELLAYRAGGCMVFLTHGKENPMPTSLLSSKGQITLPKTVREALHLHTGDQVDFVLSADGHIEVRKVGGRVSELLGALYRAGGPAADAKVDAKVNAKVNAKVDARVNAKVNTKSADADFHEQLAADDERIRRKR